MAAEELVDIPVGITGPVSFTGMPQDHARAVLADARPSVGFVGIGSTRPEIGAGDCPVQVACPRPRFRLVDRSPTQSVWLVPSRYGGRHESCLERTRLRR